MIPSVVKTHLKQLNIRPKRRFSQNFLIDKNITEKIISAAAPANGDLVIEIGPGMGMLTEAILRTGATVLAIEKDPILVSHLKNLSDPLLEVIEGDFLTFPLQEKIKHKRAKIIANIPYSLTAPILSKILPLNESISSATLMLQKEVAERCVSIPGQKSYSSLTLFVQFFSEAKILFNVKPTCFYPSPEVHSSVVQFTLQKPPSAVPTPFFFQITRAAFQKRRKMLRSSLKDLFNAKIIEESLEKAQCSPSARPEELSLSDFLRFAKFLHTKNGEKHADE
jgi:16S rRNA (adenine1518-N6/adenine1519-N6)-dimethyltransferase